MEDRLEETQGARGLYTAGVHSPLAALLDALRTDSTLAWLLVHAPDGDRDAAVRRAWESETSVWQLCEAYAGSVADWLAAAMSTPENCACGRGRGAWECAACCAAIRAAVPCPTWAELTRAA